MGKKVSKFAWLGAAIISLAVAAALVADLIAGRWLIEREALLTDYTAAFDADGVTGYQHQLMWQTFADELESRLENDALFQRNRSLAAYLAARSRLHAGEEAQRHNLETDNGDPRAWQAALAQVEAALANPFLYIDFDDPEHFSVEDADYIDARLGGRRPSREQLGDMVTHLHLRTAERLLRRDMADDAWRHYAVLTEPQEYRGDGRLLLAVPALFERALADPDAAAMFAEYARQAASAQGPASMEFSEQLVRRGLKVPESEGSARVLLACAMAARAAGNTHGALALLDRLDELATPAFASAAHLLRAELKRDQVMQSLALLTGPGRPLAGIETTRDEYRRTLQAALDAADQLADADDHRISVRARFLRAGLVIDDARYHYQFLPSLDPEALSAFAEPGEPAALARERWLAGPDPSRMAEVRETLDQLIAVQRFDDDPELWGALRVRSGQWSELMPVHTREHIPGNTGEAIAQHWLPLLNSHELRGERIASLLYNSHVAWRPLVESTLRMVHESLKMRLERAAAVELLEALGDAELHAEFLIVAATRDPRIGNPHQLAGDIMAAFADFTRDAELGNASTLYARAGWHAVTAAEYNTKTRGFEHAAPWLEAGERFLYGKRPLEAALALQRYLDLRESQRDGPITAEDIQAAVLMGEAFGLAGALEESTTAYAWAVERILPRLRTRSVLPPSGLDAFVGLGRSRYLLACRTGDAGLLQAAIADLEHHVVHATVFPTTPRDLEFSPARMRAQHWRGMAALELARLGREDTGAMRAHLAIAAEAFEDVVQRFHDSDDPLVNESLLALARVEYMHGVYAEAPLSEAALDSLRRASARLGALTAGLPDTPDDFARRALLLLADTHELLGRRYGAIAAEGEFEAVGLSRRHLQAAIRVSERLDRDYPDHPVVAWALLHRVHCLLELGRATPADADAARVLLRQAPSILGRVNADAWASESQGHEYWLRHFAWLERTESP